MDRPKFDLKVEAAECHESTMASMYYIILSFHHEQITLITFRHAILWA
jgi:hypothetical protein